MTLLEEWKNSATRRLEFVQLLREPAMVDAIAIVKEMVYKPRLVPNATSLVEAGAVMGWKREGYLEALDNFLSLAGITSHEMPDRRPWDPPDEKSRLAKAEAAIHLEMAEKAGKTAGNISVLTEGPVPK